MRLIKFLYSNKIHWGVVKKNRVVFLLEEPFDSIKKTPKCVNLCDVKVLPACGENPKVILAGLNYQDHAKELGMHQPKHPIIFLKPNTTLIGDGENIKYPRGVARLDYEAELALVISKKCKSVSEKKAREYILGYTCLNDVTARDLQKRDGQWTRAKSFDTFCPVGPWIETDIDPNNLRVKLYLNGEIKQNSSTKNFFFSAEYLVSFISRIMTLYPGDIISTGTPVGVGQMKKGDVVEVEIEGIGRLKNFVV